MRYFVHDASGDGEEAADRSAARRAASLLAKRRGGEAYIACIDEETREQVGAITVRPTGVGSADTFEGSTGLVPLKLGGAE